MGILMPFISIAFRHTSEELDKTAEAIDSTFKVYSKALEEGVSKYLIGPSIKPVFRKYN